jgi:predicted DsbA family dithiol-disulfide isomerase
MHRLDREPRAVALHLPHTDHDLAETPLKIEVYSDVACPWCFLGERRLERALEKFSGRDDVEVVFRSFQLDPTTPERAVPLLQELERKFGANARAMTQRISEAGREEGIDFDWTRALAVNTLTAHRLLRLAEHEYGAESQRRLATLLFEAHFEDGGDVGDVGELTALAVEAGLDPKRVVAYLSSGEGLAETKADIAAAQDLGITAVPTFVIDDQYAVQGAQPPEIMLDILNDLGRKSGNDTAGIDITEGSR